MTMGSLLLIAMVVLLGSAVAGFRWPRIWLALVVCGAIAGIDASIQILLSSDDWEWKSGFALGGEPLHFRLDSISAFFLILVSAIGGMGAVYSHEYWSDRHSPNSAPKGRVWWSLFLICMGLVLTVSNGLHFLIAWELFALCGYFLITLDRQRSEVRAAGWLYLAASHAGTMCLFAFFALLASHNNGSWELGPMRERTELAPLFWLALFGFGVKAGFFPLHVWLPSAHAKAPSHVSAIMSGVAIKMGIYGIVRFSGWLPIPPAAGWVVISLGAMSALIGIAFAFAQNNFKRLLAYCSVENIGIIMIGVGVALLAVTHGDAPWGRLALAGALLHVWNHGAFKSLLFFCAGSVLHTSGTCEMSRLGGLLRTMPWTGGLFALGAIAVAGLPPLNGFVSEWLVYLGLFDVAANKETISWAAIPAVIVLAMSGAIAMASFTKAAAMIFLGMPRTRIAAQSEECGGWMRGPMLALAGVCVCIGLAPILFWPVMLRALAGWHPEWAGSQPLAPIVTLGSVQIALLILILAAAIWLWRKTNNGLHRGPTWDCGYAQPTPRMQYTSASFAGVITGWFRWVLLPERKLRRLRGLFPVEAIRMEAVPDAILDKIINPVGAAALQISNTARRLQHGRLQFYILYVLAGLVALTVLTIVGGTQ